LKQQQKNQIREAKREQKLTKKNSEKKIYIWTSSVEQLGRKAAQKGLNKTNIHKSETFFSELLFFFVVHFFQSHFVSVSSAHATSDKPLSLL